MTDDLTNHMFVSGSVDRSTVVRPVTAERASLQPNMVRVAEAQIAHIDQTSGLKRSLQHANSGVRGRPPQQRTPMCGIGGRIGGSVSVGVSVGVNDGVCGSVNVGVRDGVGGTKTLQLVRSKALTSDSDGSTLTTSAGRQVTGNETSVMTSTTTGGQTCPSPNMSVNSISPLATERTPEGTSSGLSVTKAAVLLSGGDNGTTGVRSGVQAVPTVSPPVSKKRYRVVPVSSVPPPLKMSTTVFNIVTKPDSRALVTSSPVTYQDNNTGNVTPTTQPKPSTVVTCKEKTGHASVPPKPTSGVMKTTFLDAFKEHISQTTKEQRRCIDVSNSTHLKGPKMPRGNGTHRGVSEVLTEPVFDKQGILVGRYLMRNITDTPTSTAHDRTPTSSGDTKYCRTSTDFDSHQVATQQLSKIDTNREDLVLDNMLQLDGSRDVKPRDKPVSTTSNDTDMSTTMSMANGHDNDIPLHDKIARKIKAESLARSIASEEGPFKCPKCKRLYRTKESCQRHALICDFEVSTSEEEEEEEEDLRADEELTARPQFPSVRQSCDITEFGAADSTESSDVTSESEPVVSDVEVVTHATCHSTADTVSSKSYPLRSNCRSFRDATPVNSQNSVNHRRRWTSGDANGGSTMSSESDGQAVRTLRSGRRTLTPNDPTTKQRDPVMIDKSLTPLTPKDVPPKLCAPVTLNKSVTPKRGRGRPPKRTRSRGKGQVQSSKTIPSIGAVSGVNAEIWVNTPVEQTAEECGVHEEVDRVKSGVEREGCEGCDMAHMLSCRVDVCQLAVRPAAHKDDVTVCPLVSLCDVCPSVSDDGSVSLVSDDAVTPVAKTKSAVHAGIPVETTVDVSMATTNGVDQSEADADSRLTAPDLDTTSEVTSSPVVDNHTNSQEEQQSQSQQPQFQLQQQQQQQQQTTAATRPAACEQ